MTDRERDQIDAMSCYILSRRQGVKMIAKLMARTEEEVERLIQIGERIAKERKGKTP